MDGVDGTDVVDVGAVIGVVVPGAACGRAGSVADFGGSAPRVPKIFASAPCHADAFFGRGRAAESRPAMVFSTICGGCSKAVSTF